MAGKVITAAAIKGGVGKTATIGALAQAAANDGKRVLIVDTDPQANISIWQRADLETPNVYDVLTYSPRVRGNAAAETCDVMAAIQKTADNIDVLAASNSLTTLVTKAGSGQRLNNALKSLPRKKYDVIFIDTAPNMSECLNNALFAANGLIIPTCADTLSLQGLYKIANLAAGNPKLKIIGTILTQYDPRTNLEKYMKETITEKAAALKIPFLGVIRRGVSVKESICFQENLLKFAPKSNPAADYMQLYEKLKDLNWI